MTCYCGDTSCPSCGPLMDAGRGDIPTAKRTPRAMVALVNEFFGLDAGVSERVLSRALYKATNCGAWFAFCDGGIQIGSIVEGCDADVPTHELEWPFTLDDMETAIDSVEGIADVMWRECNEVDDDSR